LFILELLGVKEIMLLIQLLILLISLVLIKSTIRSYVYGKIRSWEILLVHQIIQITYYILGSNTKIAVETLNQYNIYIKNILCKII
jgi:hypothetical protein